MTPTLRGRWETRFFLLTVLGLPLTAFFAWLYHDLTPFILLGYVLFFGLAWDGIYYGLQSRRWNRDWPPLFALMGGFWEGIFLWGIIRLAVAQRGYLPGVSPLLTGGQFVAHYGTVFFITFAASYSLLPLLFPRWRFRGGQWLS
ncbi:MAG: hypothetical protein KA314_03290 [Chloroflexi bacterium]|nr:hypothetical protein [Chloroflexota bacterium]MBP8054836.1 hypothetical protein [Chloroflexota bacterium]